MRVGIGYDIHRFDPSRTLVLGGVPFEGEPGLSGHSDADVLLHAIIDALLGAAGLGDIGTHFPPGEPEWAGASSLMMLEDVHGMLAEQRFEIQSVDATVITERPRLMPHISQIRQSVAHALGLLSSHVNVKATSNEGVGGIGRGEAMAAMAVALLPESTT
jgi:2-C-methyl-D-erythritol 2,4-cyclodiphosphate synthase